MARARVAVLISGGGTNLQALLDRAAAADAPFAIVQVISNRADAGGLARAERAGIATAVVPHRQFARREAFDEAIGAALAAASPDLVCLAGFMRVLGPDLVEAWRDRMLNIHPSLLPAFPGLDTHRRALEAGVRVHGCSVHLVRPALDAGPIVVQGIVPVRADDTAAELHARVLEVEHRCYPLALEHLAGGRVRVEDERAIVSGRTLVLHPALAG